MLVGVGVVLVGVVLVGVGVVLVGAGVALVGVGVVAVGVAFMSGLAPVPTHKPDPSNSPPHGQTKPCASGPMLAA